MASGDVIQEFDNVQPNSVDTAYTSGSSYSQTTSFGVAGGKVTVAIQADHAALAPFDVAKHYDIVIKEH